MEREEFVKYLENSITEVLNDKKFLNNRGQLVATRLSAEFDATYDEAYVWSKALFLSTSGAMLIQHDRVSSIAIHGLKSSAEVYELLGDVSKNYDRHYCRILSALCFDVAGYQANAYCLSKNLDDSFFESADEDLDIADENYIGWHIKHILLKRIPKAKNFISSFTDHIGTRLFNEALSAWYEQILTGKQTEFKAKFKAAYTYYLYDNNLVISQLLFLLLARITLYSDRSVWNIPDATGPETDRETWDKYLKLLTHDYYDGHSVKPINDRQSKFELWLSQLRAIEKGVLRTKDNFVIQMPTSAGKTFIAELVILNALIREPGKKCIYIAPFRALTNEKESELAICLNKLGYSVSALTGSYELDEFQDLILNETNVLIATPEKIDLLVRLNPDFFSNVSLVVLDEGHIIGDVSSRASLVEFLVIRFKMLEPDMRILFISAVMPPLNADEYSLWLSSKKQNVIRSLLTKDSSADEQWEPTRKVISRFDWRGNRGRITYKDLDTDDETTRSKVTTFVPSFITAGQHSGIFPNKGNKKQTSLALALEFGKKGSCLLFCAQAKEVQLMARAFLEALPNIDLSKEEYDYLEPKESRLSYYYASMWYSPDSPITQAIKHGIGIHYGDMPEPVRRAVETDYRAGELRLLIANNTIGQGLNLPIKYLVIHSTILFYPTTLSVRDFWNIIGRAGRAGKETEGEVAFVINSEFDAKQFEYLTTKSNIEEALSIVYFVYDWILGKRLSKNLQPTEKEEASFNGYINLVADSYLQSLVIEETVENQDQDLIESIIGNSLFKVQLEARGYSIEPLRKAFITSVKKIREEVPVELLRYFGQTGLTLQSNKTIHGYIEENRDALIALIEGDDYIAYLKHVFLMLDTHEVSEAFPEKNIFKEIDPTNFLAIAEAWINGASINDIRLIAGAYSENAILFLLLNDCFYYRYPWIITAFTTMACGVLNISRENIPQNIQALSSFIKFGLNDRNACLARSIGIATREAAVVLSMQAPSSNLSSRDFIKWIANLTIEDLDTYKLNDYQKRNAINIAIRINPLSTAKATLTPEFWVVGTFYGEDRKRISKQIVRGEKLAYKRDPDNEFDPYAIEIYKGDTQLGFVPRNQARNLALEIDMNEAIYNVSVRDIEESEDLNYVRVAFERESASAS